MLLHVLFRQTALRRDLLDELAVITGNAQSGSHLLADGPAAAAKFPTDGNDPVDGCRRSGRLRRRLQLTGKGFLEADVHRHGDETGQGIGNGLHPHQTGYSKQGVQYHTQHRKDHAQTEHRQQQRGLPLPHRLENGVIHIEQAHADDAPGPAAHEHAAHLNGLRMVDEQSDNGAGEQLHNDQEDQREDKQDQEREAAHLMHPFVVFRAVVIADQRHDSLGNADADVQGDGAALGGHAVCGGQDIAVLMAQQQTIQQHNGDRDQQYRNGSGKSHRQSPPGHFLLQRDIPERQRQHAALSELCQHHKKVQHGDYIGEHGGHRRTGHIHLKHKNKDRVQDNIHDTADGQSDAGLLGLSHRADQVPQHQPRHRGNPADDKHPEQIVGGKAQGKLVRAEKQQNGLHEYSQQH